MAGSVQDIARFFDREACCASRRSAAPVLRGVSRILLELLLQTGVTGRSVLDAGCGPGSLAIALSRQGARTVTGVDLSAGSIAAARRAAAAAGVPARFAVADAASDSLHPHDVMVLDKVVCCYFDPARLLANTAAAARSVVALSLPHSRGLRGALARLLIGAENAWRRLRGDPFRAHVHDDSAVGDTLTAEGFRLTAQRDHWMWHVAVLETDPTALPRRGLDR